MKNYYAHSLENQPIDKWQLLEEHLNNVEKLAGAFAEEFGSKEWGALAGLWHDVGKYGNSFQGMLLRENGFETDPSMHLGKVVHSNVGGHLAQFKMDPGFDRILCWIIMGHHAGLTDFGSDNVGAKDLVRDGINGFVVDREDIDSISSRLGFMLNEKNRDTMAEEAYRTATHNSWDTMADKVLKIYDEIAGNKNHVC